METVSILNNLTLNGFNPVYSAHLTTIIYYNIDRSVFHTLSVSSTPYLCGIDGSLHDGEVVSVQDGVHIRDVSSEEVTRSSAGQ